MKPSEKQQSLLLTNSEIFDLVRILESYLCGKEDDLAQAHKDARAGKKTVLFDNWPDFIGALVSDQRKARMLLQKTKEQSKID